MVWCHPLPRLACRWHAFMPIVMRAQMFVFLIKSADFTAFKWTDWVACKHLVYPTCARLLLIVDIHVHVRKMAESLWEPRSTEQVVTCTTISARLQKRLKDYLVWGNILNDIQWRLNYFLLDDHPLVHFSITVLCW